MRRSPAISVADEASILVSEIREISSDCCKRFGRLHLAAARARGDSARLRRVPKKDALVDSGVVGAFLVGFLLTLGALLLTAIAAAAFAAWVLP